MTDNTLKDNSIPLPSGRDLPVKTLDSKRFVENLKKQWKQLWWERIDDKLRAEGIANKNFEALFVERGTVIMATRRYKPLEFKEILQIYSKIYGIPFYEPPSPFVGGWRKFGKKISKRFKPPSKRQQKYGQCIGGKGKKQQQKKGGRGWLHIT